jgi:hypothetical protein
MSETPEPAKQPIFNTSEVKKRLCSINPRQFIGPALHQWRCAPPLAKYLMITCFAGFNYGAARGYHKSQTDSYSDGPIAETSTHAFGWTIGMPFVMPLLPGVLCAKIYYWFNGQPKKERSGW